MTTFRLSEKILSYASRAEKGKRIGVEFGGLLDVSSVLATEHEARSLQICFLALN